MASYVGALTEFNPYVSHLPVDTYAKVGMMKQGMRDAGVQKIQSVVDNISGLDVANQADKEYLNGRVNELTTELNKHGNIDFSNTQYVKQLASLAAPIQNDENIINAVASTQSIRTLQKSQQEAIKSGKAENFSVEYENATYLQPYLNSTVAGQRFNGPSSTLTGNVEEYRKQYMDEMLKFKPDESLIQSSGQAIYPVQTTTGWEKMDAHRLSEYVLSTMGNDARELLKRSSWADNRQLSNSQLLEKGKLTDLSKARMLSEKSDEYLDKAKAFLEGSNGYNTYSKLSKTYNDQYKQQASNIESRYGSIDPDKMSFQQRDQIYSNLGTTFFAQGLAGGVSYDKNSFKEEENKTWNTLFTANEQRINTALAQGQIFEEAVFDKEGKMTGWQISNNPNRANYGKASTKAGEVDANGNPVAPGLGEINVPQNAGPESSQAWDLPTFNKVVGDLETQKQDINTGIYQFLIESNIDVAKYFDTSYAKNPNGLIGQKTILTPKKNFSKNLMNVISTIEAAVDNSLMDPSFMKKVESGHTGIPEVDDKLATLTPNNKETLLMPALKHVLNSVSGKTFMKVLENKKNYANTRSALVNSTRKFAEIEYGGDPDKLKAIQNASDDELLVLGGKSNSKQGRYDEVLDKKTGKVSVYRTTNDWMGDMWRDGGGEKREVISTREATTDEMSSGKVKSGVHSVLGPDFSAKFDKYLKENISTRNEPIYSTVFNSNLSKLSEAAKAQFIGAALQYQKEINPGFNVIADEATIKGSSIIVAGYENVNKGNPLDKSPRVKIAVPQKDAEGHSLPAKEVAIDISGLLKYNQGQRTPTGQKLPFVEAFDLAQYMPQATAIMMDPYHGSRSNDKIADWNVVSDPKGNKAVKYRVVWTGTDMNERAVGGNAGIGNNVDAAKSYIEIYVPGIGKRVLKNRKTGNLISAGHPAVSLKQIHDLFELSTEEELDATMKYLSSPEYNNR